MKRTLLALTTVSFCAFGFSAVAATPKGPLTAKDDKVSYSIGIDIGKSMQKQKLNINPEIFMAGLKDGMTDKYSLLPENEIKQTLVALQNEMIERQKADMKVIAEKNLTEGEKFLAENKKRKDVVTLPSGLQYRVIRPGQGESPKATDTVKTHYLGKLIDGKKFDSSYDRGEPARFPVNAVIPGWTEALQLMKPGAKWELFIPANLAYGEQGIGAAIGPNSTLIFEVELMEVEKGQANADKPAKKS